MKKLVAVVVAILMVCSIVSAQDMPAGNKAGAKSLNFTFNGLGTFGLAGTGPMGGLGASYFLSPDAAVRLGLQVGLYNATLPYNGAGTGSDGDFSAFGFGIGADYLMYMSGGRVKPYMGAGVEVTLNSNSGKTPVATGGTAGEITNGLSSDYSAAGFSVSVPNPGLTLGVAGILGAEFYIYNDISLSAEYIVNLLSMTSISDTEFSGGAPARKNGSDMSILGISGSGRATIHIYF